MLVGLISDTHDNKARTREALKLLDEHAPRALLHAGDLMSGEMVPLFDRHWTWLAQGNMDKPRSIGDAIEAQDADILYDARHEVDADEVTIGLIHGDDKGRLAGMINSGRYDVVVHGHTHEFRDERIGDVRVINPGAVHRASKPSVCVYDADEDELTRLELST